MQPSALIRLTQLLLFAFASSISLADSPKNEVLIKGKSVEVTRQDFDLEMSNIPPEHRDEFRTDVPRIQRLLERIFQSKALAQAARDAGVDREQEVAAELAYTSTVQLGKIYGNRLLAAIPVPDLEARAKELFTLNADALATPEQYHASHILIQAVKRGPDGARKLAEEIRARAIAGEPFDKLAEQYSDDQSAKTNKGDLGTFPAGKMVPEFTKAVAAMSKEGEISPIVETRFGLHIIQFHGRIPRRAAEYADYRAQFLEQAQREYQQREIQKTLAELVAAQQPVADQSAVEKLKVSFDLPAALKDKIKKAGPESATTAQGK